MKGIMVSILLLCASLRADWASEEEFLASVPNLSSSYTTIELISEKELNDYLKGHALLEKLAIEGIEIPKILATGTYFDDDNDKTSAVVVDSSTKTTLEEILELESPPEEVFYLFGRTLAALHQCRSTHSTLHPIEKSALLVDLNELKSFWHFDTKLPFQDIEIGFLAYIKAKEAHPFKQSYCNLFYFLNNVKYNPLTKKFTFKYLEEMTQVSDSEGNPFGNPSFDYLRVKEELLTWNEPHLFERFSQGYTEGEVSPPSPEDEAFFSLWMKIREILTSHD